VLSPMLYNLALEKLVRDMTEDRKMNLGELNVLLAYADYIVMMGNSRDDVIQTHSKTTEDEQEDGIRGEPTENQIYVYVTNRYR